MTWREDQTSHNIFLSKSLLQGKDLTVFNSVKLSVEAPEKCLNLVEVYS